MDKLRPLPGMIRQEKKEEESGEGGGGKTVFYDLSFSHSEIDELLKHVAGISSRQATLELALEFAHHKCKGKSDEIVLKTLVKMLRASLDGRVKPPCDLKKRYAELLQTPTPGIAPGR